MLEDYQQHQLQPVVMVLLLEERWHMVEHSTWDM
jgi:hypothetical protein